jgi:L-alanine-DL-glutamate epimerase-like enolase superfamily enzyme
MKFGWGPFGKDLAADTAHLQACREGIGKEAILMIDAGTAWVEDVQEAAKRLDALKAVNTYWLEEPFVNMALQPYHDLSLQAKGVPLAGGEGCNNYQQAMAMMDYAGISFIQIDAGRVGGITVAKRVVDKAVAKGIRYVNHTFTSHLALSASLQAYAGIESAFISEYPVELKQLAIDITREKILPDANGYIHVPDGPGLGMTVDKEKLQYYLVKASIVVNGKTLYETPVLD